MKPVLKAPGSMLLKLIYDEPLSTYAFKFNLRRYNMDNWWVLRILNHVVWDTSGGGVRQAPTSSRPGRQAVSLWRQLPPVFLHGQPVGVAMRNKIFGEGAERMVRMFRQYNAEGVFVGPAMVAKESRFIEERRCRLTR